MKNWLERIAYQLRTFLYGRYGSDEFSRFLSLAGIILCFLSCFKPLRFLSLIALAVLIFSSFRCFSKNGAARRKELDRYLKIKNGIRQKINLIRSMWRDRKTHRYLKCPNCKTRIRIKKPAKHKKIIIDCPHCKNSFTKKT